ncbi:MAG: L,D-transpeptidase family protein [Sulfurimonas sp.]|nr:L,D-transpeptidase family protein [Sulfurimonas sp.]MDQ7060998.1 L,D-transpeptidase family protein [Sulfurimonas sp.]
MNFSILLVASQQIVLVVADDFNTSSAKLECFEGSKKVFSSIKVNLGRRGLGWGLGELELERKHTDVIKYEGDKKAPAGVFKLSSIFGYSKSNNFNMPYLFTSKNLICVDDSKSKNYNTIINIQKEKPKSFEFMKRDDAQYELGIVVEHNKNAINQRGSCIFLHVQKEKATGTAGCTSMTLENLEQIASWLNAGKNPILIQIPKSSSFEILKLYPQLYSSEILQKN